MIRFNNALLPHGIHFFFPTKVNLYLFVKPAFTFLRVSIILQISVSKNFIWKMFQKRQRHLVTDRIQKNNLIEPNKKNNLKEEIIFGHCKGHDTIIFFLISKVFTSTIFAYYPEIIFIDKEMGCCFSFNGPKIKIIDETLEGGEGEFYLFETRSNNYLFNRWTLWYTSNQN